MLPTDKNPHLVPAPEGFKIGDMISHTQTSSDTGVKSKTVEKIATVVDTITDPLDGDIIFLVVKKLRGENKPYEVDIDDVKVIYRPEDITQVSDESLDDRIARLHANNYKPVEHKKKKAKASSARAITKKGSIADTAKKAVKTGAVSVSDLDELVELMEKIKRGEVVE